MINKKRGPLTIEWTVYDWGTWLITIKYLQLKVQQNNLPAGISVWAVTDSWAVILSGLATHVLPETQYKVQ